MIIKWLYYIEYRYNMIKLWTLSILTIFDKAFTPVWKTFLYLKHYEELSQRNAYVTWNHFEKNGFEVLKPFTSHILSYMKTSAEEVTITNFSILRYRHLNFLNTVFALKSCTLQTLTPPLKLHLKTMTFTKKDVF